MDWLIVGGIVAFWAGVAYWAWKTTPHSPWLSKAKKELRREDALRCEARGELPSRTKEALLIADDQPVCRRSTDHPLPKVLLLAVD